MTLVTTGQLGRGALWGPGAPHTSLTSPRLWAAHSAADESGFRGQVACPSTAQGSAEVRSDPGRGSEGLPSGTVYTPSTGQIPAAQAVDPGHSWKKPCSHPSLACGHFSPQPQRIHQSPKMDKQFPGPFPHPAQATGLMGRPPCSGCAGHREETGEQPGLPQPCGSSTGC